jgi:hypothetical protein
MLNWISLNNRVDIEIPVEDNPESEDEPHYNDNDDSDDFQFNDADEDDDSVSVFQLLPDGENELWEADIEDVKKRMRLSSRPMWSRFVESFAFSLALTCTLDSIPRVSV